MNYVKSVFALGFLYILLSWVTSCSIEHTGEVKQVITLDGESISKYFLLTCKNELPVGTPDETIQLCADTKTGEFLEFMNSLNK